MAREVERARRRASTTRRTRASAGRRREAPVRASPGRFSEASLASAVKRSRCETERSSPVPQRHGLERRARRGRRGRARSAPRRRAARAGPPRARHQRSSERAARTASDRRAADAPSVQRSGSGATSAARREHEQVRARAGPRASRRAPLTRRTTAGLRGASAETPAPPSSGTASSRASASRIRTRCARPPRAGTFTPRAWKPTSAPRESSRSAWPAQREIARSKPLERGRVGRVRQRVVDGEEERRGPAPPRARGRSSGASAPTASSAGRADRRRATKSRSVRMSAPPPRGAGAGRPPARVLGRDLRRPRSRSGSGIDDDLAREPRLAGTCGRARAESATADPRPPRGRRRAAERSPRRRPRASRRASSGSIQSGPGSDSWRKKSACAVAGREPFSSRTCSSAGRVATTSPTGSISQRDAADVAAREHPRDDHRREHRREHQVEAVVAGVRRARSRRPGTSGCSPGRSW